MSEQRGLFGFDARSTLYDVTPLENLFIQEFMLRADGDNVKAYIYALMQCYHPQDGATLESVARDLGLDPDRLTTAYSYWERLGLMRRVSDSPPKFVCCNLSHTLRMHTQNDDGLYRYADFNQRLAALFGTDRLLRPEDYHAAVDWIETVKLPEVVVLKLVEYGIGRFGKRFAFKRLEKTAVEWAEMGVRSERDAAAFIEREEAWERGLSQVLRRLGRRGKPSEDDVDLFMKWTKDWGFTPEAVLAACAETTKGAPTMAYLDGILRRQHGLGKHDAPALQAQWSREREEADAVRPILEAMGVRGTAPTAEWTKAVETWRARGFAAGSLLMAASQVSRYGGKLDDFERLLDAWLRQGLTEESAVEEHLMRIATANLRLGRLFQIAGWDRPPTSKDRMMLNGWHELGLSDELVEVAAEFAQGTQQPVPYMDKLLRTWREAGTASIAAARAEHAAYQAKRVSDAAPSTVQPSSPITRRPSKEVAEHRYKQRDYDADELDALVLNWSNSEDAG
ncbi:hypothetical protein AGMMS49992_19790 [Clostridia bacterium]|nr:hypothetical protein AGMMS49992_19790 [Clostridia bacterium]